MVFSFDRKRWASTNWCCGIGADVTRPISNRTLPARPFPRSLPERTTTGGQQVRAALRCVSGGARARVIGVGAQRAARGLPDAFTGSITCAFSHSRGTDVTQILSSSQSLSVGQSRKPLLCAQFHILGFISIPTGTAPVFVYGAHKKMNFSCSCGRVQFSPHQAAIISRIPQW